MVKQIVKLNLKLNKDWTPISCKSDLFTKNNTVECDP